MALLSGARHPAARLQGSRGPDPIHDYEQVFVYALDDAQREELLCRHAECTFHWSTPDGWPIGVVMSDVVRLERERARRGLAQEKR